MRRATEKMRDEEMMEEEKRREICGSYLSFNIQRAKTNERTRIFFMLFLLQL
jgi:hypothetical protein